MSWNPVADAVSGLNSIGALLTGLPDLLISTLTVMFFCLVYPFVLLINLLSADMNLVYQPFAVLINQFNIVAAYPQQIFTLMLPLPSEWTVIILIQILVAVSIRCYRWINEFRSWVPTWGGGM